MNGPKAAHAVANTTTEEAISRVSLVGRELSEDGVDIAMGLAKANQSIHNLHHRSFTDVAMDTTAVESATQIRCPEEHLYDRTE